MRHLRGILFIVLLGLLPNICAQTVGPHFSELRGMEDEESNTHLFYRIYYLTEDTLQNVSRTNHLYHLVPGNYLDTLFLYDYSYYDPIWGSSLILQDYTFWNNDPSAFIWTDTYSSMCSDSYIRRFDNPSGFPLGIETAYTLLINPENDSLVYGGGVGDLYRSSDGGWTFNTQYLPFNEILVSINPFNSDFYFVDYPEKLIRSADEGYTFEVVDSGFIFNHGFFQIFSYDSDRIHIYAIYNTYSSGSTLRISDDDGNQNSWTEAYSSGNKLYFSNDLSTSGNIYLADGVQILNSRDYGVSFDQFITLDDDIIGLYKKSGTNILYAQTKYKIYKIVGSDSIGVIKELPVVSVDDPNQDLYTFELHQNYPNPFNPSTKISWQSPVSGHQSLKVYDVLGNEVATLVNEYKPAGSYEVEFNADKLPSGFYFYQLNIGTYQETRKMILLK